MLDQIRDTGIRNDKVLTKVILKENFNAIDSSVISKTEEEAKYVYYILAFL